MILGTLLCALGTSLLGNLLLGKGVKAKRGRHGVVRAGDGIIRVGIGRIRVEHDF